MKRFGAIASAAALLGAFAIGGSASAFGGHAGGFHDSLWEVDGLASQRLAWRLGSATIVAGGGLLARVSPQTSASVMVQPAAGITPMAMVILSLTRREIIRLRLKSRPRRLLLPGRSVAEGLGDFCSTPVGICQLIHASFVGGGCSCRVVGGRAKGTVTP